MSPQSSCQLLSGKSQFQDINTPQGGALHLNLFKSAVENAAKLAETGQFEQAVDQLRLGEEGSAHQPAELLIEAARLYELANSWENAARTYHRAIEAGFGKPGGMRRIHRLMMMHRIERGDLARALESVRQALSILHLEKPSPLPNERAELQTDLGDLLARLGMRDLAKKAFDKASFSATGQVLNRLNDVMKSHGWWVADQEEIPFTDVGGDAGRE